MEREVGGGIGMGNTCKPMAISFQCMTKSTTNKNNNNNSKYIRNSYNSATKRQETHFKNGQRIQTDTSPKKP